MLKRSGKFGTRRIDASIFRSARAWTHVRLLVSLLIYYTLAPSLMHARQGTYIWSFIHQDESKPLFDGVTATMRVVVAEEIGALFGCGGGSDDDDRFSVR